VYGQIKGGAKVSEWKIGRSVKISRLKQEESRREGKKKKMGGGVMMVCHLWRKKKDTKPRRRRTLSDHVAAGGTLREGKVEQKRRGEGNRRVKTVSEKGGLWGRDLGENKR